MTRLLQRIGLASFLVLAVALLANLPAPGQDKKPPDKKDKKEDKKSDDKKGEEKPEPKKEPVKLDNPLVTLKAKGDWLTKVVFHSGGKLLATSSRGRNVKVWDLDKVKETKIFKDLPNEIKSIVFLPEDRLAACTGKWDKKKKLWQGEIKILDIKSSKEVGSLKGHGSQIEALAVSADGKKLASAGEDQTIIIWDASTGKDLLTLKGHTGTVWAVAFSKDGSKIASASADRTVRIWDAVSGKDLATITPPPPKKVDKKDPDKKEKDKKAADKKEKDKKAADKKEPDKKDKGKTKDKGKPDPKVQPPVDTVRDMTCVLFTPEGDRVIAGNLDGTVKVFDISQKKEVLNLKAGEGIWAIALSPDGKRLASGGWDKIIRFWDTASGKEVGMLRAHEDTITSLAYSPDGQRLASASKDQTVKVWDAKK